MSTPKYTKKQWEAFSKDIGGESSFAKLREKLDAFEAGEFQFNQGFIKKYGKRGEFPKNDKMWEGRDAAMDANYKQHFTKAERKTIESEEFEESRPLPADKPKVKKLKGSTSTRPAEVEMQDNPKKKGTPKERFVQSRSKPMKPKARRRAASSINYKEATGAGYRAKPATTSTSKVAMLTDYSLDNDGIPLPSEAGNKSVVPVQKRKERVRAAIRAYRKPKTTKQKPYTK